MSRHESGARSDTAFARRIPHDKGYAWVIGNDRIAAELAWAPDAPVRLTELSAENGLVRFAGGSDGIFSIVTGERNQETEGRWHVVSSRTETGEGLVRLVIQLAGPEDMSANLVIECRGGQELLRQWLEIIPSRQTVIREVEPAVIHVEIPGRAVMDTVSGVQQQGGWRPNGGPYRSFRLEHRELAEPVGLESGLRSTWDETPWAALTGDDSSAGGILLASEYGGRWTLAAQHDSRTGVVTAAFAPVGLEPELAAGQAWTSPATLVGLFTGDLDSAAAVMHRYVRDAIAPSPPDDFPWVQYNTWYSYHCDLDAETLLAEAEIAASLGVEVFYVDAGWWVGSPYRRDYFSSGLGNWTENRQKFPGGLRAFAEGIRDNGLHFGLWVEPERVDLRTASTGTWQQAWLATRDGQYIGPDWPPDTDTAWLCFGCAETQAWAERWIGDLVAELGIRWLKWDSNYWGVCTSLDHGHGAGDGEAAQLAGVYAVMGRLRERFPDLIIENCAGGGTRMDFALARQTHTAWMSDASEPAHRTRFHMAGASYLYPPEMLNAWVTESTYENLNEQDLPDPIIRATVRSRMIGALGISCQMTHWSDQVRQIVTEEIGRYKREIRPLLGSGMMAHLLPQPELQSPRLATPGTWEAYQLTAADRNSAVVLAFRNVSMEQSYRVRLKGLDPDARYALSTDAGMSHQATGQQLLGDGVGLTCDPLASVFMTIRRSA